MLKSPPKHSVEAAAGVSSVLVLEGDDAWDRERIDREVKEHCEGDKMRHPVYQYLEGWTRYDLDTKHQIGGEEVSIRTYLRDKATEFRIRRLSTEDMARVQDWINTAGARVSQQAFEYCCRCGVVDIKNIGFEVFTSGGELTSETMLRLYDCSTGDDEGDGVKLISEIGRGVWRLSQPLSYAEKKA